MVKQLLFVLVLLLVACGRTPAQRPQRLFPVNVGKTIQRDIPIYIEAIGNITSPNVVDIKPQVTGKLIETHVKDGQLVKKGDLLFSIDKAPFEAALKGAKATLEKDTALFKYAEKTVARFDELVKKEFVSPLTYDQYLQSVEVNAAAVSFDKAAVETAELNLAYCSIRSPIDGLPGQLRVDPGNLVVINNPIPLTTIQQITPIGVTFSIPQQSFLTLQSASEKQELVVEVLFSGSSDVIEKGKLSFVDNTLNTTTGTITLKGILPNAKEALWPGEFVRVRILLSMRKDAVLVPLSALSKGQPGDFVYVVKEDNKTVELRVITLGPRLADYAVVEKGLLAGETVVTDGQLNLRNNAPISIKK